MVLVGLTLAALLVWLLYPVGLRRRKAPGDRRKADPNQDDLKVEWCDVAEERGVGRSTGETYLIVGGGFVGRRIARALRLRGETKIKVFDLDQKALDGIEESDAKFVEKIRGDVTNLEDLMKACKGVDCVFSTFAIIRATDRWSWQFDLSFKINVVGTENLLQACIANGVKRFIETSTAVVSSTTTPPGAMHLTMDESSPLCTKDDSPHHYALTKKLAEDAVLRANGKNGLATGSIRPCCSIIGYGDKQTLERMMRLGSISFPDLSFTQDFTPVDSIVMGHLLLEKSLREGPKCSAAGEAFCISNEDPWSAEDFADVWCDLDPKMRIMTPPLHLTWVLAYVVEFLSLILPTGVFNAIIPDDLKALTPPMIWNGTTSYAFKCDKARRVLGYEPVLSTEQGLRRALREYRENKMILSPRLDMGR